MQITETKVKVSDLCKNYSDNGDGGVFGYDGKLTIRPAFQREVVYKDKQRDDVIETVRKGYPLNVMYWSKVIVIGVVLFSSPIAVALKAVTFVQNSAAFCGSSI